MEMYLEDENIIQDEQFRIKDLSGATWAFRKLQSLSKARHQITNVAAEEIQKIADWEEREVKKLDDDMAYFEGLIEEYYRTNKAQDSKFKLSTPFGKVKSRKFKKWIYEDEEELLAYCNMNEIDVVRVKETLDKAALKKLFEDGVNSETGEVLPFVRIEEVENIDFEID